MGGAAALGRPWPAGGEVISRHEGLRITSVFSPSLQISHKSLVFRSNRKCVRAGILGILGRSRPGSGCGFPSQILVAIVTVSPGTDDC